MVADLLTDDAEPLAATKSQIAPDEWARTGEMAKVYMKLRPGVGRDGQPGLLQYEASGYESKGLNIGWK